MNELALIILAAAGAGFTFRLMVGPTLADRTTALSGLLLTGMGAIATQAAHTGTGVYLPALVAIALVGPISTAMVARFIEDRSE